MAVLLQSLLILGLVALNAFFVAAEYALLSVRRTRLEQLAAEGHSNAQLVQALLADVGRLFSGIQLGITIASLLMGWLGESIISDAIQLALEGHLHRYASFAAAHAVSMAVAFLFVATLLMVLGELVPKTVAYERAEQVAMLVARPMTLFFKLSRYPVKVLGELADHVIRTLGRLSRRGHGPPFTAEEVKLMVSAIRKGGLLGEEQEEMIHSVFDLHRTLVREIMVPRPKITCLPLTQDFRLLLEHVVKDQHSRIPIYDGSPEHIVGILNTKDLLHMAYDRLQRRVPLDAPLDLRSILHEPMVVPETVTLSQMLEQARRRQSQMALVVDEFGTFVGLVTIEDVLEQIVGEIQDEYDREERAIRKVSESVMLVDGSLSLRDLAEDFGLHLPRNAGYETLAGFVLAILGSIPQGGETFVFEGHRYTVVEMERRRVAKVRVEKLTPIGSQAGAAAGAQKLGG